MEDEDEAKAAIAQLNGHALDGVNIKVEVGDVLSEMFCNFVIQQ